MFFKTLQNSQKKYQCWSLFFHQDSSLQLYLKRASTHVIYFELCKCIMNTFLIEQLWVVSSGIRVKTINNNIYKKKMLKIITILEYYVGDRNNFRL